MPYSIHRSGKQCAGRSGFTLIELLIVIGIITILIVLGLSVAGKVSGGGKARVTEQTIRVLDQALSETIQANGSNPDPWIVDPRPANNMGRFVQPVIDGRSGSSNEIINSVGFFMLQCQSVPAAKAALTHLDSKFLREYTPDAISAAFVPDAQPSVPTAFDAWGHPIRYVHPFFKGTIWQGMPTPPQNGFVTLKTSPPVNAGEMLLPVPPNRMLGISSIRRNNTQTVGPSPSNEPDSDGGLNPATRPYFYSAGPDGDPSTIADNIYLAVPRVAKN